MYDYVKRPSNYERSGDIDLIDTYIERSSFGCVI